MNKRIFIFWFILMSGRLMTYVLPGYIWDSQGNPLDNVYLKAGQCSAITNAHGRYELEVVSQDELVYFHRIGYEDVILPIAEIPYRLTMNAAPLKLKGISVESGDDIYRQTADFSRIIIDLDNQSAENSLPEILKKIQYLSISGSGLTGEEQKASVAGFLPRHIVVLLDGVPLNAPGEAVDLSLIPIALLESIVINKTGFAEVGSGAMGAVIDLRTDKPGDSRIIKIKQNLGAYGMSRSELSINHPFSGLKFRMYAGIFSADNDFTYQAREFWDNPDSLRIRRENRKQNFDLNIAVSDNTHWLNWDYSLYWQQLNHQLPGPTNTNVYLGSLLTGNNARQLLRLSKALSGTFYQMDLIFNREETEYDNRDSDYPDFRLLNRNFQSRKGIIFSATRSFFRGKQKIGFEYQNDLSEYDDVLNENNSIAAIQRDRYAIYFSPEYNGNLGLLSLNIDAGTRYETFSDLQDQSSLSCSAEMTLHKEIRPIIGIGYSRGYTVPSFYDLYWVGDSQAIGNPELKSESSRTWQVRAELKYRENSLAISRKHDRINNLIYWFPNFNQIWKPANLGEGEIDYLEINAMLNPINKIMINLGYSAVRAIDRSRNPDGSQTATYGKSLIYTPEYNFVAGVNFRSGNADLNVNYRLTGPQWTTRDQLSKTKRLSEYGLLNTGFSFLVNYGSFQFNTNIQLKNMLNTRYEIYAYSPQPGFNWTFGLELSYH
ncbi:MAG: TonB-dependent receptor [Candidatus Cloacimonetes bacterium]|nr:TonB-dependent receptor [Candidatus Cloacimonadota bacterium]